ARSTRRSASRSCSSMTSTISFTRRSAAGSARRGEKTANGCWRFSTSTRRGCRAPFSATPSSTPAPPRGRTISVWLYPDAMLAAVLSLFLQTYGASVEVRVVNVDVVVTDKAGHRVTGLTKNDFEILEDGKPQTITNFDEER